MLGCVQCMSAKAVWVLTFGRIEDWCRPDARIVVVAGTCVFGLRGVSLCLGIYPYHRHRHRRCCHRRRCGSLLLLLQSTLPLRQPGAAAGVLAQWYRWFCCLPAGLYCLLPVLFSTPRCSLMHK